MDCTSVSQLVDQSPKVGHQTVLIGLRLYGQIPLILKDTQFNLISFNHLFTRHNRKWETVFICGE